MLRITEQKSTVSAKGGYASSAYYGQGRGIVGCWGGKGACRLRLRGTVDKVSLGHLCNNMDPRTKERVTVRTRCLRTVGYTFRFSVCKSVSLLYGLSGDRTLLDAFRVAVGETMRDMEREMKTRIRRAAQNAERVTGNMVWAEFIHTTSSPVEGLCDPQLHAYVFVLNLTWDDQEQRWKAGKFRDLKSDAPYFQAAFRVRVANNLQDIGFGVRQNGNDFEIAGIPPDVLKRFSRRTELIERVARQRGITDPRWKAALGPKTREGSMGSVWALKSLRKEWNDRLTEEERKVLASVWRRKMPFARQVNGEAEAVDQAIQQCLVRAAVVPERTLVTEALKRGIGAVTVEGVKREVTGRQLARRIVGGRAMVVLERQ